MPLDFEGTHIVADRPPGPLLDRHDHRSSGGTSSSNSQAEQAQRERITQRANQLKQQFPTFPAIQQAYNQKLRDITTFLDANPGAEFSLEQKEEFAACQKVYVELQSNNAVIVTDVFVSRCTVPARTIQKTLNIFGYGFDYASYRGESNGIKVTTVSVKNGVPNYDTKDCLFLLIPPVPETSLLLPQIALQTADKRRYVCAERGGGELVNANRYQIDIWETFTLLNYNSDHLGRGEVHHGDKVSFLTHNGYYVRASSDGARPIEATHPGDQGPIDRVTFTIESKSGNPGPLEDLEEVLIRDFQGLFLIADHGGGGGIHRSTNPGLHETFILCKGPIGMPPRSAPTPRPDL